MATGVPREQGARPRGEATIRARAGGRAWWPVGLARRLIAQHRGRTCRIIATPVRREGFPAVSEVPAADPPKPSGERLRRVGLDHRLVGRVRRRHGHGEAQSCSRQGDEEAKGAAGAGAQRGRPRDPIRGRYPGEPSKHKRNTGKSRRPEPERRLQSLGGSASFRRTGAVRRPTETRGRCSCRAATAPAMTRTYVTPDECQQSSGSLADHGRRGVRSRTFSKARCPARNAHAT